MKQNICQNNKIDKILKFIHILSSSNIHHTRLVDYITIAA